MSDKREEEQKDEKIIYLVVRNDLKMGKGKIAAQCGHAIQYAVRACKEPLFQQYEKNGCKKICLKVDSFDEFAASRDKFEGAGMTVFTVVDAGHTQVEPNTQTCFAVGPVSKDLAKDHVKNLKLL